MVFPKNNLPTDSQPWTRDVEKRVENLESSFRSAEVNNVTRDSQALSQIRRLDAAVTEASTAAANAQAAIDGLGNLDQATSTYKINAANVTVGTLSGNRISGGQIIGTTLYTSSTGPRIELNLNDIKFYDDSGNYSGKIDAQGDGRSSTLNLDSGGGLSGVFMYNGGMELYANGLVEITTGSGLSVPGGIQTVGISLGGGNIISVGSISNVETGGSVRRTALIGGGTTGASITDGGNFVRTSSSQRYKQDIQLLDINLNDLYAIEPKTFRRIEEVEERGEEARIYPGFIAEELAGTSLDKFVFYSQDEEGNPRPEGIHYPELTAALLLAIKDLNARIQVLEGGV